MSYEVELKFPLPDHAGIAARLEALGATSVGRQIQRDTYFGHPGRDFAKTDEALRIRDLGTEQRVTYKGPIVDPQTKTRREIELPIGRGADDARKFAELLQALGFRPVREVAKTRQLYRLNWKGRELELALDRVEGLGEFLEIETQAEEFDRDAARDVILHLAARLALTNSERRSYLQLLLERDGSTGFVG